MIYVTDQYVTYQCVLQGQPGVGNLTGCHHVLRQRGTAMAVTETFTTYYPGNVAEAQVMNMLQTSEVLSTCHLM